MKKLTCVVDADAVVCDFFKRLFAIYEERTGDRVPLDAIATWDMTPYVKHPEVLQAIFHEPGFFASLDPVPGALDGLKEMVGMGHTILVVTSPCNDHSPAEKISWFRQHVPAEVVDPKHVFVGHAKHWFAGDVMVDDGAHNAHAFRAANPNALILGPKFNYNDHHAYDLRLGCNVSPMGSKEFYEKAWVDIVEAIRTHSKDKG